MQHDRNGPCKSVEFHHVYLNRPRSHLVKRLIDVQGGDNDLAVPFKGLSMMGLVAPMIPSGCLPWPILGAVTPAPRRFRWLQTSSGSDHGPTRATLEGVHIPLSQLCSPPSAAEAGKACWVSGMFKVRVEGQALALRSALPEQPGPRTCKLVSTPPQTLARPMQRSSWGD